MDAWWISALVGGRVCFPISRIQDWWSSAQVVVTTSSTINSPRLQPHLDGNIEKLVGVVRSSRTSSGYGDLRIFIGDSSFFFISVTDVDFSDHSTT
jgi:hypothetical protein